MKLSNYISYLRLKTITEVHKPYRGRKRAEYPYWKRSHGQKYFTADELDGEQVYRLFYGDKWIKRDLTKEEYDGITTTNKYKHEKDGLETYFCYDQKPYQIGIVRPDNSFEFTMDYINQSELMLLNNILFVDYKNSFIQRSVRHGGVIVRNGYSNGDSLFYPAIEGMRIDIATHIPHEAGSYKIIGRRVNRKSVNDLLGKYKEMFLIAETMMKTMSVDDYINVCMDLCKETVVTRYITGEHAENALSKSHMLDAFIFYAISLNSDNLCKHIERGLDKSNNQWWVRKFPDNIYTHYSNTRRAISKHLYKQHEDVMKEVEFEFGKKYPASEWGYEVYKNGVEVKQY
jgi:hypothetical protein